MQHDEKTHVQVHVQSAGVAILDEAGRILLVQEKDEGIDGLWHIPAGTVEAGEMLEDAARREAKEETGLDVELIEYLNVYIGRFASGDIIARHVWLAKKPPDAVPSPLATEEIAECRFFSWDEFNTLYDQGEARMYHTKLMFRDARAAIGRSRRDHDEG